MTDQQFTRQLISRIEILIETTEQHFYDLPFDALNYKVTAETWSVLECIEHLNHYCRFYLPQFHRTFRVSGHPVKAYTRGWLGEKLIKMVEPANTKKKRTLRHMNPSNSFLTKAVLDEFIDHQNDLLNILQNSQGMDLNKKTVPVEFFRILKMKRGVALEFIITHQERHIQQASRSEKAYAALQKKQIAIV